MKQALLAAGLFAGLSAPGLALPGNVPPQHAWVFVAGLLKFENSKLASWKPTNRRDAKLVEYFRREGVPADHIVYLADARATLDNLEGRFSELLRRAGPEDTLFFYYAGHGGIDSKGVGQFSSYDAKGAHWKQNRIVNAIQSQFKGNRAWMLADCCNAGCLAQAVERLGNQRRTDYFVLTSCSPNQSESSHWTFSEGVLQGLAGNPAVDLNGDGIIDHKDLATYLRDDMVALEDVRTTCLAQGAWQSQTPVATATGPRTEPPARVSVRYEGQTYRAKVMERRGSQVRVRWLMIGYDAPAQDSWVPDSDVTPIALTNRFRVGQHLHILSEGKWYPGRVLELDRGLSLVRYDNFATRYDTWMPATHLK